MQAGTISVGDFHHVLQEVTNFPLRPFVLPFLKANIPGWQTTRSFEHRPKLGAIAQSMSPTQPNLAVAILLQAAPLLMSPFTA